MYILGHKTLQTIYFSFARQKLEYAQLAILFYRKKILKNISSMDSIFFGRLNLSKQIGQLISECLSADVAITT